LGQSTWLANQKQWSPFTGPFKTKSLTYLCVQVEFYTTQLKGCTSSKIVCKCHFTAGGGNVLMVSINKENFDYKTWVMELTMNLHYLTPHEFYLRNSTARSHWRFCWNTPSNSTMWVTMLRFYWESPSNY
jgi:hypothetical protein